MGVLAGDRDLCPAQPLAMGDNADILALGLQDRPLFDMQFEKRVHLARANLFLAAPSDPRQLVAKALSFGIGARIGPVLRVHARKDTRTQHRGGKTRALLVGPVGGDDGVFGADAQVVQGADHLQPGQNPQHPVIFAARRLGIQMRAHIDRQRIRVSARSHGEHVAHLIQPHGTARRLAPILEQRAAFAILIRQGLAVIAARHAGADLGHLHQTVPQPVAVDSEILCRSRHTCSPVACFAFLLA